MGNSTRFSIVTPVLNGAQFIDETILSVVSQAGPFTIRYHVQDGGSTDGTLDKLACWRARLAGFPSLCGSVAFSYASAPDRGMYEAVNRGFAACGEADVMSWINADDRFQLGAFATVAQIFGRFDDVEWLTGRSHMIDEVGTVLGEGSLVPFPREAIAAGVFDGRASPRFIQQEGTFWRSDVWRRGGGGTDIRFRLAGDFELWRRFARYTDLVVADATLGAFRKRAGQATTDLSPYHAEIDQLAPIDGAEQRVLVQRMQRKRLPYRVIQRTGAVWVCHHHLPVRGVWALRRLLPRSFSIRARLGWHWIN